MIIKHKVGNKYWIIKFVCGGSGYCVQSTPKKLLEIFILGGLLDFTEDDYDLNLCFVAPSLAFETKEEAEKKCETLNKRFHCGGR